MKAFVHERAADVSGAVATVAADPDVLLGDSTLPPASVAGGSSGTSSWGSTIVAAARQLRSDHGESPAPGDESTSAPAGNPNANRYSLPSFGAQFVELRVNLWTGEPRLSRMLGVFSAVASSTR